MPKHSTSQQLLRVVEYIHHAFNNFEHVWALYLDVVKACDIVWQSCIIYKMTKLKFPTTYAQFILSYLSNRIFDIHVSDNHSTCRQINAGISEESNWDPRFTEFTFMTSLHIHTPYWRYMQTTQPSWLAIKMQSMSIFTYRHTFLILRINKSRIEINLNKSQAIFFSNQETTRMM